MQNSNIMGCDGFDQRMSAESRAYVSELLKMAEQVDYDKIDLKSMRKLHDEQASHINGQFNFENLSISEIRVKIKNPFDNYEIKVVKYEAKKKETNTPITVFFHGGGFCISSTTTHHLTIAKLATRTNSTWLSVEYRLCPEHKYPIPFLDCRSVVEWALENKYIST